MRSMKAMRAAMKSMRRMKKAKKVSIIAKGKMARSFVFRGAKEKTQSGLTKAMLTRNKAGKIVSKRASARGKKNFASNSTMKAWAAAVKAARKALSVKGFTPVGGKTAAGKALYAKAKTFLN